MKKQSQRLWEKGGAVHEAVHRFTVGNDPQIDLRFAGSDAIGSAAHARMLAKLGILSAAECRAVLAELRAVRNDALSGTFEIPFELEDCHTAIEARLTSVVGEAGGKIHTGRSRNDQVLLAVRLYLREQLVSGVGELLSLFDALAARYGELKDLPMPGYTHLQPAMPSSVGMWLHAFAEWSSELVVDGLTTLDRVNTNPLGTASGFGVPVPLDRAFVAELLDLSRIQRSPIDAQNSRGRYELKFTRWAVDVASMVEKLSQDLQLFSMREFGFFALPTEMTTGSSIMPQKHNPDVLELLRASTAKIRAAESELQLVIAKLPSNYHRDFQLTKEPLVRAAETLAALLPVAREVVKRFSADGTRLAAAMTDDLYVTYDAFRRVRDGLPFRDAYRKTAERMGSGSIDFASLRGDFAIIAHDVERAFAELRSETEQRRSVAAEWSTRLQRIAECIWAG